MCRQAAVAETSGLPTPQRNALCRHFERADFTPEEVAAVGRRRLLKIDGIGEKGLCAIEAWLARYGLNFMAEAHGNAALGHALESRLERAVRLLRAHGYRVEPGSVDSFMQKTD